MITLNGYHTKNHKMKRKTFVKYLMGKKKIPIKWAEGLARIYTGSTNSYYQAFCLYQWMHAQTDFAKEQWRRQLEPIWNMHIYKIKY